MQVQQAIQTAIQFANQVLTNPPLQDVRLEEVEKDGDGWLITVSYVRPNQAGSALGSVLGSRLPREWRIIKIDTNGQPIFMKVRAV
jgi:hypothetical protein